MALAPGTRIGSYEIAAQIGVGGMGEVYRATDTKLKRDVAIKVLPEALAADAERLARFQREAEVLASLNHSGIAHIYGIEDADGSKALVMELVEGPTLADRIAQGRIPVDEALAVARQIAEALEAAHEQGIVHRDLKPANVKVRQDGTVKVLDFGLAKAMERAPEMSPNQSLAPTITTPAMTQAGMILGTAAYMSPEQARGRPADRRSDVWAFGCVLFEMLTGRRALEGEDVSDTLAAVLRSEPDWNALPPGTPPGLRRLLRRCLQRDPRQRARDIGDVHLDIVEVLAGGHDQEGGGATPVSGRARWLPWGLAIGTSALAVVLLAFAVLRETATPAGDVRRLEMSVPPGTAMYMGGNIGISPDGSAVAFIGVVGGSRQIYVRRLDEFEARAVRGTETATVCCAFSPDGRSVLFNAANQAVQRVSLADGLVETLATGAVAVGGDWGADGSIVFVRSNVLWQVPADGGEPGQVTTVATGEAGRRYAWPTFLPDARAVVVATAPADRDDWRIEMIALDTGESRTVVERGTFPKYTPTGHLVFYRDAELLAAPFDVEARRVTGTTVRVLENLPANNLGVPVGDISESGVLGYAPNTSSARLVWVSREGAEQTLADVLRVYTNPRLGPGDRWVLVQAGGLWRHDVERATFTLLSEEAGVDGGFPVLTPDGTRVVYRTPTGLSWQPVDGSGSAVPIPGTSDQDYPATVSPDGRELLFVRLSPETSGDIYLAVLGDDAAEVKPVLVTSAYEGSAQLSPDGRWLVYSSDVSGQMEVYLRPYPGPDRRWQVSTEGGTQPMWHPSGGEIFYRHENTMMAVGMRAGDPPSLSEPQRLFDQAYSYGAGITIPNYDVSDDGRRFVMVKEESNANHLYFVLNWFDELRRLVPTN